MKPLTHQEKAAIYYHIGEGVADRAILYTIAFGADKANSLTDASLKTMSSNWFKSHRIQSFLNEVQQTKERELNQFVEMYIKRVETEASKPDTPPEFVDLLNYETFLNEINRGANQAKDEKEKREYLKMISDNMRYKDTERDEATEIQRFYTPIDCTKCEIYNRCKGCNLDKCERA